MGDVAKGIKFKRMATDVTEDSQKNISKIETQYQDSNKDNSCHKLAGLKY